MNILKLNRGTVIPVEVTVKHKPKAKKFCLMTETLKCYHV